MSDTWGRNPYPGYSQQAADWERQQAQIRAEEDRRYYENLATLERSNLQQLESMRQNQTSTGSGLGDRVTHAPDRTVGRDRQASGSGVGGLAVIGAIIGLLLAADAGASAVGGLILGGLAGALVIPVLQLIGWLTVTVLKIAFFAIVVILVLAVLSILAGG